MDGQLLMVRFARPLVAGELVARQRRSEGSCKPSPHAPSARLAITLSLCVAWVVAALQSCFAQPGQLGWDEMYSYFGRF